MDYSKLSDFEINLRVAEIVVDYDCMSRLPYTDMAVHWGDGANWHVFNPCNNPADAWPIITSNRIGIVPGTATDKWAAHHGDWDIAIADVNPLRAAMIIFLMMQDSRKSSS